MPLHHAKFLGMAALLTALANACSDGQGNGGTAGNAGNYDAFGGGSSAGASGGVAGESAGGEAGARTSTPVWNEYSQRLELACSGPFGEGAMIFRADRAQLTPQQLEQLNLLRAGAVQSEPSGSDNSSCRVSITSDTGAVSQYAAGAGNHEYPALELPSLEPLLDSIPCKFLPTDGPPPPLTASASCWHGVSTTAIETHQGLELSQAGRSYHIELDHCAASANADSVMLRVFGTDPETPIAVGAPVAVAGSDATCVVLDVEVSQPITADLVIAANGVDPYGLYYQFR